MSDVKEYVEQNAILDNDDHVVVKEMWDGNFRANVWKYNPNRIVQSFFITVSESGIKSSPTMGA